MCMRVCAQLSYVLRNDGSPNILLQSANRKRTNHISYCIIDIVMGFSNTNIQFETESTEFSVEHYYHWNCIVLFPLIFVAIFLFISAVIVRIVAG